MIKKEEIMNELLKGGYNESYVLKVINRIHKPELTLSEYTEIIQKLEECCYKKSNLKKYEITVEYTVSEKISTEAPDLMTALKDVNKLPINVTGNKFIVDGSFSFDKIMIEEKNSLTEEEKDFLRKEEDFFNIGDDDNG